MARVSQNETLTVDAPAPVKNDGSAPSNGERGVPRHLKRLYAATIPFGIGCGISLGITPTYLPKLGFNEQNIGTLSLFFAAGLVLFALPVGAFIRKFSAERVMYLSLFIYGITLIAFPWFTSYEGIGFVRFFDGMGTIGVWVASETILLGHAPRSHKAYLTTLYAIFLASGYVIGPFVSLGLAMAHVSEQLSFAIGGIVEFAAALFVFLMLPSIPPTEKIDGEDPEAKAGTAEQTSGQASGLSILWKIKTSCFAAFSYGYFQAAAVLFLPRFVIVTKGIADDKTRIFPGLFCFGMLACSNIAGRIADRVGHLKTVRVLSSIGLVAIFGFAYMDSYLMMCLVIIIAGATFASMSPVALALTGVVVKPHDYSRANSIYNMFYATGILLGPVISGAIFQRWGGATMLQHQVALWAVFVVFATFFRNDDPAQRRRKNALPAH